jgi:glycerol kinase
VLEGIAYRTRQVLQTLLEDASVDKPERLRVDGGAAANDFLLQQLADIIGIPVERPKSVQASALGAAYLAGWAVGVWDSLDTMRAAWRSGGVFEPKVRRDQADVGFERWRKAIESVRSIDSCRA